MKAVLKAVKARKYWNLFIKQEGETQWSYHFGDYEKSVVKEEQADVLDSMEGTKGKCWIIQSEDTQADIDRCIAYVRDKA